MKNVSFPAFQLFADNFQINYQETTYNPLRVKYCRLTQKEMYDMAKDAQIDLFAIIRETPQPSSIYHSPFGVQVFLNFYRALASYMGQATAPNIRHVLTDARIPFYAYQILHKTDDPKEFQLVGSYPHPSESP